MKLRKGRITIAVISVVMGAAMVSALANISLNIKGKLDTELRAYGANIIVEQKASDGIREEQIRRLKNKLGSNLYGYAPSMARVAEVAQQQVVVEGTEMKQARRIFPWWKVKGQWPASNKTLPQALVGINASRQLKIKAGQEVVINYQKSIGGMVRSERFNVTGLIETGGAEDNQIIIQLTDAKDLFQDESIDNVKISVLTSQQSLEKSVSLVAGLFPRAATKTVQQIANAEENLLKRIQLLLLLVTAIILAVSAISVMSTMAATVMERRKEIGIMKSIGAENKKIALIFNAEAAIIGLAGGVVGFAAGALLAQIIGKTVFNTTIAPNLTVIPLTVALALILTLTASRGPVKDAVAIDPIITLRGE